MSTLVSGLKHLHPLQIDRCILLIVALLAAAALLDPGSLEGHLAVSLGAFLHTAPYLLFAVLAVSFLKATGAEKLVASAFKGNPIRMVVVASLVGGLAPFCSCEVIPFIAGLMALGAPLPAVLAFWLSSPINDPAAYMITMGALGIEFANAKVVAAVGLGLFGGLVIAAFQPTGLFADILRPRKTGGCCGGPKLDQGKPFWPFWREEERLTVFKTQALENTFFLAKWLLLAYVLESFMLSYIPAETIAGVVGGEGVLPIVLGALAGIPAYLNGYAAPAIVSGLMDQGMLAGAGLAFIVAGGVTCIPAMAAVWPLVKPRVFVAYICLGFSGAVLAGLLFQALV
ncbi:MAG: permease [Magnetovibrionaceae bacterium]